LAYGVKDVPDLYKASPDQNSADVTSKGVKVKTLNALHLQTPALFDFRADQDNGIVLQQIR
jgi:hypothetical protein